MLSSDKLASYEKEEIYNPWSVINYIAKGCIPQAYWVNTGKNEILEDVLKVATDDITERLYARDYKRLQIYG